MCIIFYYIAKYTPSPKNQHFKFILAANRDEFYFRSSKVAHFWQTDPNILAGQDLESGGTWLGINKRTGRLATVTNIMSGTERNPEKPKISRGNVIANFLKSQSTLNGETYCQTLYSDPDVSHKYNKFNLLTFDFPRQENTNSQSNVNQVPMAHYFTNASNDPPVWQNSTDGQEQYFGLSNSVWTKPFQKVSNGCTSFQQIIENHNDTSLNENISKAGLTKNLLEFLRSDLNRNVPDPQIESQANEINGSFINELSSTFVCIPPIKYGTRTHTILFVDYNNQVDFSEWTMIDPINPEKPTWVESNYKFQLFT